MNKTLIEITDGLALAVRVDGNNVKAVIKKVSAHQQEIGFVLELSEPPMFTHCFDIAGLPRPLVAHELFIDWVRGKIPSAQFKKFAEPIAQLAQQAAIEARSAA